jgi:hypothetical protein
VGENLSTGLVTASAVLLGGLIAAGAGFGTTIVNQNSENTRVEQRVDDEARGAARILISRFNTDLEYVQIATNTNEFPTFHPDFIVPQSKRDVELTSSRLSVGGFRAVDSALRRMTATNAEVAEAPGADLTAENRRIFADLRLKIRRARNALLAVADLPPYPDRRASSADGPEA